MKSSGQKKQSYVSLVMRSRDPKVKIRSQQSSSKRRVRTLQTEEYCKMNSDCETDSRKNLNQWGKKDHEAAAQDRGIDGCKDTLRKESYGRSFRRYILVRTQTCLILESRWRRWCSVELCVASMCLGS